MAPSHSCPKDVIFDVPARSDEGVRKKFDFSRRQNGNAHTRRHTNTSFLFLPFVLSFVSKCKFDWFVSLLDEECLFCPQVVRRAKVKRERCPSPHHWWTGLWPIREIRFSLSVSKMEHLHDLPTFPADHDGVHLFYMLLSVVLFGSSVDERESLADRRASEMQIFFLLGQALIFVYSLMRSFDRTNFRPYFSRHPCGLTKDGYFHLNIALIYTIIRSKILVNDEGIFLVSDSRSLCDDAGFFFFRRSDLLREHIHRLRRTDDDHIERSFDLWSTSVLLFTGSIVSFSRDEHLKCLLSFSCVDICLTRWIYLNGFALWTSFSFYQLCRVTFPYFPSPWIGVALLLVCLGGISVWENTVACRSDAYTFFHCLVFVFLLRNNQFTSVFFFFIVVAFSSLKVGIFVYRYRNRSIPVFQGMQIYSLIDPPREF